MPTRGTWTRRRIAPTVSSGLGAARVGYRAGHGGFGGRDGKLQICPEGQISAGTKKQTLGTIVPKV